MSTADASYVEIQMPFSYCREFETIEARAMNHNLKRQRDKISTIITYDTKSSVGCFEDMGDSENESVGFVFDAVLVGIIRSCWSTMLS